MKQNNHNTHFYSIQEVERCLKSTEEFKDGEQLFYFIGALRYIYDENKKKDKEIERLKKIIKNLDKMFEYYFIGNKKYDENTVNTIYIKYIKLKELKEVK